MGMRLEKAKQSAIRIQEKRKPCKDGQEGCGLASVEEDIYTVGNPYTSEDVYKEFDLI